MTREELQNLANELNRHFEEDFDSKYFYEIWPDDEDIICADISWGDWKHDHLWFDYEAEKFLNSLGYDVVSMDTEVTDEDGSDTYSAIHSLRVRKHVEESLGEEYVSPDDDFDKWSHKDFEHMLNELEEDGYTFYVGKSLDGNEHGELEANKDRCLKEFKDSHHEKGGLVYGCLFNVEVDEDNKKFKCTAKNVPLHCSIEESSNGKGEEIAQLIAKAYKGRVGPFGGENPYLDGNEVTLYSQGGHETFRFNEDGSVDNLTDFEKIISDESRWDDYGLESEEEAREYFKEISHFDSVRDLFDSGLSWFMEVPNEEELLKKIDKILSESLKESVESKVRLENPRPVSWEEMYLRDVCGGDVDEYNELYADSVENDFGDEPCQFFFDVLDDKDNYLGKIGVYLFEGMGMWYEIGFEPNEKYLNKDKLELEDMDLPVDGWFPEDDTIKSEDGLLKSEEQMREFLKPYLAKIESAIEYSSSDLED